MAQAQQNETDRNYDAFLAQLPQIMGKYAGMYALLHECQIVEYYRGSLEATLAGAKRFGLGAFSVQEVTDEPEHLGFYSYVGGSGPY